MGAVHDKLWRTLKGHKPRRNTMKEMEGKVRGADRRKWSERGGEGRKEGRKE